MSAVLLCDQEGEVCRELLVTAVSQARGLTSSRGSPELSVLTGCTGKSDKREAEAGRSLRARTGDAKC